MERTIETSTVKAPTAGLVLSRNARTGLAVETGGEPLFVLAEDGALELEVEVAEADLPLVREGQPAIFHLSGHAAPLTGTVRHRAARIDAASRMGRVRIALEDPAGLVVGAFVSGRIEVFARRSVLVPATAVRFTGDGATITTVEDGIVSKRSVEIGQVRGDLVEVIDGLAPGVLIVLKAGSFLKPGEPATPAHLQYRLPFENGVASDRPVSAPTTISRAD
ncbi:efflux RND transporter periplasmic adaptor subunit [Martelella soudanensis]|uniref:efflux RND transporter periplasmic adaptor subunit n=1 Tax=Martelella sp. NC18 TaxID=2740297 RepID=UPI0015DEDC02